MSLALRSTLAALLFVACVAFPLAPRHASSVAAQTGDDAKPTPDPAFLETVRRIPPDSPVLVEGTRRFPYVLLGNLKSVDDRSIQVRDALGKNHRLPFDRVAGVKVFKTRAASASPAGGQTPAQVNGGGVADLARLRYVYVQTSNSYMHEVEAANNRHPAVVFGDVERQAIAEELQKSGDLELVSAPEAADFYLIYATDVSYDTRLSKSDFGYTRVDATLLAYVRTASGQPRVVWRRSEGSSVPTGGLLPGDPNAGRGLARQLIRDVRKARGTGN